MGEDVGSVYPDSVCPQSTLTVYEHRGEMIYVVDRQIIPGLYGFIYDTFINIPQSGQGLKNNFLFIFNSTHMVLYKRFDHYSHFSFLLVIIQGLQEPRFFNIPGIKRWDDFHGFLMET